MGKKIFVIDESINALSKGEILEIQARNEELHLKSFSQKREVDESRLSEEDTLINVHGKVIVKVDLDSKDSWTFQNGQKIEYKRRFNNFNEREVNPVNAIVISGEGIKKGSEILVHHNSIHDSSRIFNYKNENSSVRYYSIPKSMCFAYYDNGWKPMPGFDFALRVFKPYEGAMTNIPPAPIKDTLYCTTGELQGNVVKTLVACDFELVFQDKDGREARIIRFRPFGCPEEKREEEAIAILNELTEKVNNGKLLIGLTPQDAKPLEISAYAD